MNDVDPSDYDLVLAVEDETMLPTVQRMVDAYADNTGKRILIVGAGRCPGRHMLPPAHLLTALDSHREVRSNQPIRDNLRNRWGQLK